MQGCSLLCNLHTLQPLKHARSRATQVPPQGSCCPGCSAAWRLLQEVALIGMLGYLSYLCGELLGLSGIVTLFCCAVVISHYALHNISAPARVTLVRSCQTLSYLSEGAIFIYLGMDTLDPLKCKVGTPASSFCAALPCEEVWLRSLQGT